MQEHDQDQPTQAQVDEDKDIEEGGAVSLTDLAVEHLRAVLKDGKASHDQKTKAANALAQIERQREKALEGQIHRLTRAQLQAEMARVRDLLGKPA